MTYKLRPTVQPERLLVLRSVVVNVVSLAGTCSPVLAQSLDGPPPAESSGDPVLDGINSSFAFPVNDLLHRKHDSTIANLLDGLTVTPAIGIPLTSEQAGGVTTGALNSASTTANVTLRYQPVGHWFAQATVYGYLQPERRARWNPDFTYSFGYDDWHPYTFSLVYSNYANNRFSPRKGDPVTPFGHGTVSLGWKAPMPDKLARLLLVGEGRQINCRVGLNASPRYDRNDGGTGNWKTSANLGCRYPFTDRLFVDVNLFAYAHGQQPWDPDYTYSFGLFDYRSNRFSIQYANYSGNRFPGRSRARNSGRFKDGGISISWNHGF
jgi:hypothetical protein